ncbi:hypothetical protein BDZ94DRAFT_1038292 [Collybia nuda]|uniref:MARVEL domain-containing protein n=1 Tax=Collybia nuda TaxID=64659 RepID=A0A9P5YEZ2_9AGAR|nr:hypothetical protein BDZ94DRAFT_1038292 [Collybia nuda]
MTLVARNVLYGFTLSVAVVQSGFCFPLAWWDELSPHINVYGTITGLVATMTWIWMSVLIAYNNRPASIHNLTRSSSHFISNIVFAATWLVLAITLTILLRYSCFPNLTESIDGLENIWCFMNSFILGWAWLLFILTTISAVLISYFATHHGTGLPNNIALNDLEHKRKGESNMIPDN